MKATGIVRNIDPLGRLVMPKELRKTYGIGTSDPIEIFTEGDYIILKKYSPGCVFCGETDGVKKFQEKFICRSCADKFIKQFMDFVKGEL